VIERTPLTGVGLFEEFNDANLLFLGDFPTWVIWTLGLLAVAVLIFSWFDLADIRGRRRGLLMALRGMALFSALFLLLEPSLELRNVTRIRNHVAVLIDSSLSMSLPHDGESTRWEAAQHAVTDAAAFLTTPNEQHYFEFFRFDSELHPTDLSGIAADRSADGPHTHILEAIQAISERFPRQELGGIVILSDGTDSGLLSGRVAPGEPLDTESRRLIESLGVPVHTVELGRPEDIRDLTVERVLIDDFAFVRNRVAIGVARETGVIRNEHAAQDELSTLCKAV
jgi:hypothetical protein